MTKRLNSWGGIALLIFFLVNHALTGQRIDQEYIQKWKAFYPSNAVARGMHDAIYNYEDFSSENIQEWLAYNISVQKLLLGKQVTFIHPVNARMLRVQVTSEIDKWNLLSSHLNSLSLYASPINRAVNQVFGADYLVASEQSQLICERLEAVQKLSKDAITNLKKVGKTEAQRSLRGLKRTMDYIRDDLSKELNSGDLSSTCEDFEQRKSSAVNSIQELIDQINNQLLPKASEPSSLLGKDEYTRRLALYTDSDLTPEALADMALKEIELVRGLIGEVSKSYLESAYPNKSLPEDIGELTALALADMEKDAPINAQDYLEFWQDLKVAAVEFIQEHQIATLPKNETLQIKTAPESAGAAARIGWVASAPPFDPNPMTTLFLPSIPETLPKQEQIEFWASFNKPFNRMIVIHELLPGHYMQMKISRETPHHIRLLFPYGIYTEGWATFTERVLLDAGWEKERPLTLLAHLRKRIENANRAYTSVMVHTQNWTQDQVMEFSTNTSLVAPQFAKSLWGRIMRSPLQLTSYFLGGAQFTKLLAHEKERLGDKFNLTLFMDTIMQAGPIPIDEFYDIFKQSIPD